MSESESLKEKAEKIIKEHPGMVRESLGHRVGASYVKVGRYRVYFDRNPATGEIIIGPGDIFRHFNFWENFQRFGRKIFNYIFRNKIIIGALLVLIFFFTIIYGIFENLFVRGWHYLNHAYPVIVRIMFILGGTAGVAYIIFSFYRVRYLFTRAYTRYPEKRPFGIILRDTFKSITAASMHMISLLMVPFLYIFKARGRALLKERVKNFIRAARDPWTYKRVLYVKPRRFLPLVLLLLILLRVLGIGPWDFVPRAMIASRLNISPSDVSYVGENWYKIGGERITARDKTKEPLTVFVNPVRWLTLDTAPVVIRRRRIGSDKKDYGEEYVPLDFRGGDFWVGKYERGVRGGYVAEEKGVFLYDKREYRRVWTDIKHIFPKEKKTEEERERMVLRAIERDTKGVVGDETIWERHRFLGTDEKRIDEIVGERVYKRDGKIIIEDITPGDEKYTEGRK